MLRRIPFPKIGFEKYGFGEYGFNAELSEFFGPRRVWGESSVSSSQPQSELTEFFHRTHPDFAPKLSEAQ